VDVFIKQYFDFPFMGEHFLEVLGGFWVTLQLSFWGGLFALVWGLILALIRNIPGRAAAPVRAVAIAYIDVFRGIPLLIIILMISGGFGFLPFLPEFIKNPELLGQPSIFWYGVMALTITYGAYFAEIYRAGIEAVPHGQMEASRSLGMSWATATRTVILPQAIRKVIPPFLNDYIALMKDTSLVSVIAVVEVVRVGRELQSEFFDASALTLGAILFLCFTLPLARVVDWQIAKQNLRLQRAP
jgi:polar amino acid transport system permease protein